MRARSLEVDMDAFQREGAAEELEEGVRPEVPPREELVVRPHVRWAGRGWAGRFQARGWLQGSGITQMRRAAHGGGK